MLKYFALIAREMLFLHGHFTRPEDLAPSSDAADAKRPRGKLFGSPGAGRRSPRPFASFGARVLGQVR